MFTLIFYWRSNVSDAPAALKFPASPGWIYRSVTGTTCPIFASGKYKREQRIGHAAFLKKVDCSLAIQPNRPLAAQIYISPPPNSQPPSFVVSSDLFTAAFRRAPNPHGILPSSTHCLSVTHRGFPDPFGWQTCSHRTLCSPGSLLVPLSGCRGRNTNVAPDPEPKFTMFSWHKPKNKGVEIDTWLKRTKCLWDLWILVHGSPLFVVSLVYLSWIVF